MKIVKKVLIIIGILIIQSLTIFYRIISKFWNKNKEKIKRIIQNLDKELRVELQ